MDRAKLLAKVIVASGLVWVWPGPTLTRLLPGTLSAPPPDATTTPTPVQAGNAARAVDWFRGVRASCNPVEVDTRLRWSPPPESFEGHAYEAACLALAGRIDRARAVVSALPEENRWRAAGIMFDQAHPVADAGDDAAAGPVMELVVEYWPNHYMALYHAGASRYEAGDHEAAGEYLRRFLAVYDPQDGWTRNARDMLERMGTR